MCGCRGEFLGGWARFGGVFAAIDDDACWAFIHSGLGIGAGRVFGVIDSRQVVGYREELRLLYAKGAGDASDFAELPRGGAGFLAFAGDGHDVLVAEGEHFNKVTRAGLGAGGAAGAFFVVDGCQAVDYVEGVEFAGGNAIAVAETAEFAGLCVGQGVGGSAASYALVMGVVCAVVGVCPAMNNGSFWGAEVANLKVKDGGDFVTGCLAAGCTFSYQVGFFGDGFGVGCAASESACAAINVREHLIYSFDLGVDLDFELFTCYEKDDCED